MATVKVNFEYKKQLRQIDVEMPHGTVVLQYDAADGSILSRLTSIYADFKELQTKPTTPEQTDEFVKAVDRVANCIDFILNTNASSELFKEVAPMTSVMVDGKQLPLVFHILKSIEPALLDGVKQARAELAKEFVEKHA